MESTKEKGLELVVIGAGDWVARYHLPAILKLAPQYNVHIKGIWNRTISKAQNLARQFGIQRVYNTVEDIIKDPYIDCAIVVVNSMAVGDLVKKLSACKIPILCEKPPGKNSSEAKELADVMKSTNVVGFNRRYAPLNRKFKALIDSNISIHFVECHFFRRHRDTPCFVTETGIHAINLMEYFFGNISVVQTQKCFQKRMKNYNWIVNLEFTGGVKGIAKFFPNAGINMESFEVHGDDLSAYIYSAQHYTDEKKSRIVIYKNTNENELIKKELEELESDPLKARGFIDEYIDFFEAVRSGSSTVSNFQNAWSSLEVAEAIEYGRNLRRS